jgi:glycosyltransferase involved in cell wall biosynthesis
MRVLQLSKFYPPAHGGIEAVARDLSAGLTARGLQVQVLCANHRSNYSDELDALGVRIVRARRHGQLLSVSVAPSLPWLARRMLHGRGHAHDIVHVHMPDPLAALAVWTARPQVPLVLHWHSDVVRQRLSMHLYEPLQRWLLQRADAVIATSQAYAESSTVLRPWLHKVEVIPIGAPAPVPPTPESVAEARHRYGDRRIVFALGRMTYYKGYEVLIEAAAALPPDVVVVVGGGGDGLARYRALANERGVGGRVRFVGPLTQARVESYFAAAEVFCLASTVRAEAFGVAVLEAMARGLPVVSTQIPGSGLPWLNQHGVTGLKVPPGDPQALATALRTLLDDAELRRRCGAAGRARWEQHFSAETMCAATVALYRRLLGEQAAAPALAPADPDDLPEPLSASPWRPTQNPSSD